MTESMVERVARAICVGCKDPPACIGCKREARAAIEAMREPTKAMCRAVYNPGDEYGGDKVTELTAESIWERMIDAVLKD